MADTFVIEVMLRPENRDPQGEAIMKACGLLGFGSVTSIRQGKRFVVTVDGEFDPDRLASEVLTNPVMEVFKAYRIEQEIENETP